MPEKSVAVFVIDDDESIRRALKRLLRSCGYHAVTFGSDEEFMEATCCHGEGCLVLDIRLPAMTGLSEPGGTDMKSDRWRSCEWCVMCGTSERRFIWKLPAEKIG
jgi:DNA-binding NtrC family response regulator